MRSPDSGLFVTNHLNLMFSLAAGLITPPSGFGDKYYKDTLSEQPGLIPLFIKKVPKSAIELSIEEATYLIPIIVVINLEDIEFVDPDTPLFENPPPKMESRKSVRFGRAPISITQIQRIYCELDKTRDDILSQAQLRNNVPLKSTMLKRRKTSFSRDVLKNWEWQPQYPRSEENTPVHRAQASGGILAMLQHVKSRSTVAMQAYEAIFETESQDCAIPGLNEWMANGVVIPTSQSVRGYLLWSIVTNVAEHRNQSSDNDLDDLVLHLLEHVPSDIRQRIAPLCNTLRKLGELGGLTIPEYFNLHQDPLERAIILFFMRRECEELLEQDYGMMSDMDWAYSAILFGARSGWLRLSLKLRGNENLRDKICNWMASYCHHIENIQ